MKVKRLRIKNIGLIADADIALDQPLILFYGDIQEGKTTYLNAIRWCFGGAYPSDIIRHGEKAAEVALEFDNGSITRQWYVGKEGEVTIVKSRPILFIRDGKPVADPVHEIKKLLNPYLLDQNYLLNQSERERRKYFSELFAVDTGALDTEYAQADLRAKELRAKISGYGDIDLTPVLEVDATALRAQIDLLRAAHLQSVAAVIKKNEEVRAHNAQIAHVTIDLAQANCRVKELSAQLQAAQKDVETWESYLSVHEHLPSHPLPEPPIVEGLEVDLAQAISTNARVSEYQKNLGRSAQKKADQALLFDIEARQKEIKESKITKLADISKTCGIEGLTFNEVGDFSYQGVEAGMLSTSQIMVLSSALASKYPAGFGLDLIDRGESLGTTIFKFIDRAKAENKTILATIVGEKPATIPIDVGVFVVENGKATAN